MREKLPLTLAVVLLSVGGLQMTWAALANWTGAKPKQTTVQEVQSEARLIVEAQNADKIRLFFPELPLAIDQPFSNGAIRIPVKFRAPLAPTRVQVQVWQANRVISQSRSLVWSGGGVMDLGKPQLGEP